MQVIYRYQGNAGERVPQSVQKLIVNPGIHILPDDFCCEHVSLREVTLPEGLVRIGGQAFSGCTSLLEIKICSTVEFIGASAFSDCKLLTIVFFEEPWSSLHRLAIGENAFLGCSSLQRIKIPSSVNFIAMRAFRECEVLIEADLSKSSITEIIPGAFGWCPSLQSVSLPNTLEHIGSFAFFECFDLVTVVIPRDSRPIEISMNGTFSECFSLANLQLPNDSVMDGFYIHNGHFSGCTLLRDRFGEEDDRIIEGLMSRYDSFAVHKMCYNHSTTNVQELRQCLKDQDDRVESLLDRFGMTPFHVLFSTVIGPSSQDLLQVLLDEYPYQHFMDLKDANEMLAIDYLINNWTGDSKAMLHMALQSWMVDPLSRWGAVSWSEVMESKVQFILTIDNDKERRSASCNEACSTFAGYSNMETTSILEMALWKAELSGWNEDHTKRQALDRDDSRCVCGSNVVIPSVAMFLGITARAAAGRFNL